MISSKSPIPYVNRLDGILFTITAYGHSLETTPDGVRETFRLVAINPFPYSIRQAVELGFTDGQSLIVEVGSVGKEMALDSAVKHILTLGRIIPWDEWAAL